MSEPTTPSEPVASTPPIMVKLVANNNVEIETTHEVCQRMITIKSMLEDVGMDVPIQLDISEPILREVVAYAEHRVKCPVDPKFLEKKPGPMDPYDSTRFLDFANTLFVRGECTVNAAGTQHPKGYVENPPDIQDPLETSPATRRKAHYPLNLNSLLVTANYLDFQELLMAVARTIVSRFRDKDVAKLRAEWDIINDLTPEDEARIRAENEWFDEAKMPPVPTIDEIKRQVASAHEDLKRYEAQRAEALKQK